MGVVERRSSLRSYSARRMDSYEGVGGAMGCVKLEAIHQCRYKRIGDQGCSPMHAHWPATWERAVCAGTGGADKSPAGSAQRRPSGERRRCETNGIQFRVLVALRGGGERPVCPQVSGGTKTTLAIDQSGRVVPKMSSFTQEPSPADKAGANAKLNIVLGAGNPITPATVFVYNSSGIVCSESWKVFTK